jgi:signal peptidase
MHPTINDRETVTVEPVPPSDVKRGDIVLYRNEGGVVAHRVIRIERNNGTPLFILRGDALGCSDESVAAQQVLGKVVCVERNGRSINPYGWKSSIFRTAHNCAFRLKRRLLRKPLKLSP